MKDTFNTNFYLAAATVIPLLYITLFLQSQVMQTVTRGFAGVVDRVVSFLADRIDALAHRISVLNKSSIVYPLATVVGMAVGLIYLVIIVAVLIAAFAGIVAEALSLWALYYQSDNVTMRAIVLWSMIGLLVLAAANPTITIIRNLYNSIYGPRSWDTSDEEPDSTEDEDRDVDAKPNSKTTTESSTGLGWPQ
jgi:hypothetical protein